MNTSSRVSVIIPTYNRAELLRLTVDSVLQQTYPNIELIVVDDGSPDHTPQVMEAYGDRVVYIRQENQGPDVATARGYEIASGKYINFFDHDDLMYPTKIERQVAVLDSQPDVALVHCRYEHINEHGQCIQKAIALPDQDVIKNLLIANFIWSGAPLIRKDCLDTVGLFDDSIWCSDWELWLRIALAGYGIACVQEALGAYRIVSNSVMSNVRELEVGVFTVLDKTLNDPRLPADAAALKDSLYSRSYFEMFSRYAAAGQWDDASRTLAEFLKLRPGIIDQPDDLWQHFWNEIIKNPRVSDPASVIEGIFKHVPLAASKLRAYRDEWLANAMLSNAFNRFNTGDIDAAQTFLTQAVATYPGLLDDPKVFIDLLNTYAVTLPVDDPFQYAESVFANLPDSARKLLKTRRQILGDINIILAFQKYSAGQKRQVVSHVLNSLRYSPALLKKRGVPSILIKSLQGYLPDQDAGTT